MGLQYFHFLLRVDEKKQAWVARKLRFSKFNDPQLKDIFYMLVLLFFLIYCFQSKDKLATSLASLGNYLSGSLYLHSYQMAWVQG